MGLNDCSIGVGVTQAGDACTILGLRLSEANDVAVQTPTSQATKGVVRVVCTFWLPPAR